MIELLNDLKLLSVRERVKLALEIALVTIGMCAVAGAVIALFAYAASVNGKGF